MSHQIRCDQVRAKFLHLPDFLDFALPDRHICLLTDDGSSICPSLARSLSVLGWSVVVLSFPESVVPQQLTLPSGVSRVQLADLSEDNLKRQLAVITHQHGQIAVFIHLNPFHITAGLQKSILKYIFLMAKHLKKSLVEAAKHERSCFLAVTHLNGMLGIGRDLEFEPISGGFCGLTKTLNLEWSKVFCRTVDLHPKFDREEAAQLIISELHDPNRLITEIGYSPQGRSTLTREESFTHNSKSIKVDSSSVFLVSGGGRGITAQCVIRLAQETQCQFILLGRSILNSEPAWAKGCFDEAELKQLILENLFAAEETVTPAQVQKVLKALLARREVEETLRFVEQAGGKAIYLSADITNLEDLKQKLHSVPQEFRSITGIVHGAGNLADKLIEHKSEQDFESVYAVKVEGLKNLLGCVEANQLNYIVLFSSAAGFFGNIGQADYAIANEILNKFAHWFKHQYPRCQVICFNWGPWDGGMVTPALKQLFIERQVEVIPVKVGTQILVDRLTNSDQENVQVVVGGPLSRGAEKFEPELRTHRIRRKLALEANPFLQDHVIGKYAVLPVAHSIAWFANICEQVYPGYQFFSYQDYRLLKGIVFDDTLAPEYIMDLRELNKSQPGEIDLVAKIWSFNASGEPCYHYSAQLQIREKLPHSMSYESFDIHQAEEARNLFPYQDGTLFHGAGFQGVKRVLNISTHKLTLECILPSVGEDYQGQFLTQTIDPIVIDISYQSMLIWARHFYQAGSLPSRVYRGEIFQSIPQVQAFCISMEVQFHRYTKLVTNIIIHSRQGEVYARVQGAEVTISKRLNSLFVPQNSLPKAVRKKSCSEKHL